MASGAVSGGGVVSVPQDIVFTFSGSLNANQDVLIPKVVASYAGTATLLGVALQEAPLGSTAIFEFFKNASSLGTVTVAISGTSATTAISTGFASGDVFSVTINQVGSAYRGTTATMYIRTIKT